MHPSEGTARLENCESLSELGCRLVESAWAENTRRQDRAVMRLFQEFARRTGRRAELYFANEGTEEFEEQDRMLVEFVAYMAKRGLEHSTCKAYLLSLGRQYLTSRGHIQVSKHVKPMLAVSGLERLQGAAASQPKKETRALTAELLRKGLTAINTVVENEKEQLRMKALICLGVALMLRISELIPSPGTSHYIRWGGVTFKEGEGGKPQEMRIVIPSSKRGKAPVAREIVATWSEICAVRAMHEYMRVRASEKMGQEENIFGAGSGLRRLSEKKIKAAIRAIATACGEEGIEDFTSKSMRVGGVTTLTEQTEVADHTIQRQGRWSSEAWKKFYERPTKKTKQSLAKFLG